MKILVLILCLINLTIGRPEAGFLYHNGLKYHHFQPQQHQQHNGLLQNLNDDSSITQQQLPEIQTSTKFTSNPISHQYGLIPNNHPIDIQDGYTQLQQQQQQLLEEEELSKERPPQPQLSQSSIQLSHQSHLEKDTKTNLNSFKNIYESYNDIASSGYPYPSSIVQKHIYVHVPPKDFEEDNISQQPRINYQSGLKQKHYKIIFIKAPSNSNSNQPIIAPPPVQNEEKTIIYVLHKKPEQIQDIVIPTAAPTPSSKPEVYFIKYKTTKNEQIEKPIYGPPPTSLLQLDAPRNNPIAEVDDYLNQLQNQENANEETLASLPHREIDEKQIVSQANVNSHLSPQIDHTLHEDLHSSHHYQQQQVITIPGTDTIENIPPTAEQYGSPNKFYPS